MFHISCTRRACDVHAQPQLQFATPSNGGSRAVAGLSHNAVTVMCCTLTQCCHCHVLHCHTTL